MKLLDYSLVTACLGFGLSLGHQILVAGFLSVVYGSDEFYFSLTLAFFILGMAIAGSPNRVFKEAAKSKTTVFPVFFLLCLLQSFALPLIKVGAQHGIRGHYIALILSVLTGLLCGRLIQLSRAEMRHKREPELYFFIVTSSAIPFALCLLTLRSINFGFGASSLVLVCMSASIVTLLCFKRHSLTWRTSLPLAFTLLSIPTHQWVNRAAALASPPGMKTVFAEQGRQKHVLIEVGGKHSQFPGLPEHILYADGVQVFSSTDEQAYHACLGHIPVAASEFSGGKVRDVLILGGGDGLIARNLVSLPRMKKVALVEPNTDLLALSRQNPKIRMYNLDSLQNPLLEIYGKDPFQWVQKSKLDFDLILIDLPLPRATTLARFYSFEFYHFVFERLRPNGFLGVSVGHRSHRRDTPSQLSEVVSTVKLTLSSLGYAAHPYYSRANDEMFILSPKASTFDMLSFAKKVGLLETQNQIGLCAYRPSWDERPIRINRLSDLVIQEYQRRRHTPFPYESLAACLPD